MTDDFTQLIEAAVAKFLPAEAQFFKVHTLEAQRTLVALTIGGAVGVWDGQAIPCHVAKQMKNTNNKNSSIWLEEVAMTQSLKGSHACNK